MKPVYFGIVMEQTKFVLSVGLVSFVFFPFLFAIGCSGGNLSGPPVPKSAFKKAVDSCNRWWWQHGEQCDHQGLAAYQLEFLDGDHQNKPFGTLPSSSGSIVCQWGYTPATQNGPGSGSSNVIIDCQAGNRVSYVTIHAPNYFEQVPFTKDGFTVQRYGFNDGSCITESDAATFYIESNPSTINTVFSVSGDNRCSDCIQYNCKSFTKSSNVIFRPQGCRLGGTEQGSQSAYSGTLLIQIVTFADINPITGNVKCHQCHPCLN
jgi:hypothetical protein